MASTITVRVSIPVWCDLETNSLSLIERNFCVSIPVWCDLEYLSVGSQTVFGGFNSSMVRFGEVVCCEFFIQASLFQFQYGAIWSCHHPHKGYHDEIVSIPVWCDLENNPSLIINACKTSFNSSMVRFGVAFVLLIVKKCSVSIPVWCDLELLIPGNFHSHTYVSIPVWCDLELVASKSIILSRQTVSIPVWCDLEAGSCRHSHNRK